MDDLSEDDDEEQVCFAQVNYGFDFLMKIAKVACIIASFVAVGKAGAAFRNADKCTDPTSAQMGFAQLDTTIKEIESNSVANICIEIVMLLFLLMSIYFAKAFNDYDPEQALIEQERRKREEEEAREQQEATAAAPTDGMPMQPQPGMPPPPPPAPPRPVASEWTQLWDAQSNKPYWMNNTTRQTTWQQPAGMPPPQPPPHMCQNPPPGYPHQGHPMGIPQ